MLVDVELWLCHHFVENLLERSVDSWRWLKTNIIRGISPGPSLPIALQLCPVKPSIICDLACLGDEFGSPHGPLLAHMCDVGRGWLGIAISVNIIDWVLFDELAEPTVRIHS